MSNSIERKYTKEEEFINTFTHFLGAMFAIFAIVMLAEKSKNTLGSATSAVYGSMLFILFQSSTCYHAITNPTAKKVFRKIDHSAIYLLIAGTYTPILMLVIPKPYSVIFMSMIWYLAITGIVFSCITLEFKRLSTGLYILMGWLSLFLCYRLWIQGHKDTLLYLLSGGIVYTVGTYFYIVQKKYYHCIWHLFVLGGAILHYLAITTLL